jgi:predicted regulator of Ras-like GTPase activity (Roadblock/LC7/MglB family)
VEPVVTTVEAVCGVWPETIRQEIEKNALGSASISIPSNRLEALMKTGRVVFPWGELVGWLNTPPATPSVNGDTQVELPLKVIAPLFMARHRAGAQKTMKVGENIPDLFVGLAKPASPEPVAAAVTAAVAPESAPTAPAAPSAKTSILGQIFGQPSKSEWSPQEIAQGISTLPGVTGALLTTTDGLLVAGQAQPPLNVETLAAFVPQMFGRMAHYSGEAKLGTLEALTLTVGQAPHMIFKAGTLYLAAVGKPGQPLPEAALHMVAAELAGGAA